MRCFTSGFIGLGLDTATEIALLGPWVAQTALSISPWIILIFPMLFAAGMTLIDTTDGVMMLGVYEWAFVSPLRRLYYNMTITLLSIVVALLIRGSARVRNGKTGRLNLRGPVQRVGMMLNENFSSLGFAAIVVVFLVGWLLYYLIYRIRHVDTFETARYFR